MQTYPVAALIIGAAVWLGACDGGGGSSGGASPGPFFEAPFDVDFPAGNLFDHDLPKHLQFVDTNGYTIAYDGTRRTLGEPGAAIDGHEGYDWIMPGGTPLQAVAAGEVFFSGAWPAAPCSLLPGSPSVSATAVLVRHVAPDGHRYLSSYGHLSSVAVARGEAVGVGQLLGFSGNTGCSTAPHLHFSVYREIGGQWVAVDPYGWTGAGADPWSRHARGTSSAVLWKPGHAPALDLQ